MRAAPAILALCAALAASPVAAAIEAVHCDLRRPGAAPLDVAFRFDRSSFAPPVDRLEPPRRKVAQARVGSARFEAEALLMADGTRGFWSEERGLLVSVAPGGTATLTQGTQIWRGHCEATS